jgi:prefoldin subunit 5
LINGTWNASFTIDNPYYSAITGGNYNVVTEKSVVEKAKKLVDEAIAEANGGFNYWFYNPKDERMEQVSSGSLSSLIESAKNDLANLEKDLEKLNAVIEAVSKFDAKAGSWEDFFNGNVETAQYLDEQIAKIEANIAQLEGRVKVVEAAIASLIAAYEAGELNAEFPAEA